MLCSVRQYILPAEKPPSFWASAHLIEVRGDVLHGRDNAVVGDVMLTSR